MSSIKKIPLLISTLFLLSPMALSCANKDIGVEYLKVLNSEDYIDPTLIESFEKEMSGKGKKVKIIYDTFDTMENMYNTIKTGKTKYDLVCASEYMIQKLINLDLLTKIDFKNVKTYDEGCSKFIRDNLSSIKVKDGTLNDYAVCYMWGTLGLLYNPNYNIYKTRNIVSETVISDMQTFDSLWDNKYNKTISIKDSMRDTYAIGLIHSYKKELLELGTDYEARQKIFDYGGEHDEKAKEHIKIIENNLIKLRSNIFGFEVDSGKEDIITEKIGIDTAWSGDACKSINTAQEEKGLKLYYSIPSEGSNLWFDCWVSQNGENKQLQNEFLTFLSRSDNAIKNMQYIGYTSSIATNEVFDFFNEKYKPITSNKSNYDVSYFFGEGKQLNIDNDYLGRQINAQFPKSDVVKNLMIMKDYGNNNDLILKMWEEVKHESLPLWAIVLFITEIILIALAIIILFVIKNKSKRRRLNRKLKTSI